MPSFLNRKVLAALLVLAIVGLGRAAWNLHSQRAAIGDQLNDLESKLANVQEENQFLASSSAYFKSDEYLEKQARMKLNYKLPDENVAFIYPDKGEKVASASGQAGGFSFSAWLKNLFK